MNARESFVNCIPRIARQRVGINYRRLLTEGAQASVQVVAIFIDQFQNAANFDPHNYTSYSNGSGTRVQNANIGFTHTFTPTLLNDFHAGFVRYFVKRGPPAGVPDWIDMGVTLNQTLNPPLIKQLSVSGFFTAGDNTEATFVRDSYEFSERLSWIHGRHSMSFGLAFERNQDLDRNQSGEGGTPTFNGNVTTNLSPPTTGPYANILMFEPD